MVENKQYTCLEDSFEKENGIVELYSIHNQPIFYYKQN